MPPGRFRDRRRLDAEGRRWPARPLGHVTCLTDKLQSSARDGKSLPADKGWGHNKVPISPERDFTHPAARTQEVSGAANAEGYFGSNFPHFSCRMVRGPHQDYSIESTTSRNTSSPTNASDTSRRQCRQVLPGTPVLFLLDLSDIALFPFATLYNRPARQHISYGLPVLDDLLRFGHEYSPPFSCTNLLRAAAPSPLAPFRQSSLYLFITASLPYLSSRRLTIK